MEYSDQSDLQNRGANILLRMFTNDFLQYIEVCVVCFENFFKSIFFCLPF